MGMVDWLLELFNNVDVRAVDSVCRNLGYELTIEDGAVTAANIREE